MSKPCTVCGLVKALSEYGVQASRCDGLKSECKICSKAKRTALIASNPIEARARHKAANIKTMYGLDNVTYTALVEACDGKCTLCGKVSSDGRALAVDHCHSSNKVRGLLCTNCNLGLGHFKDSVAALEKAITYLKG